MTQMTSDNARTFYEKLKQALGTAEGESAALVARQLMTDIAGLERADFTLSSSRTQISSESAAQIEVIVARRLKGEPLGRILGYRHFWKERFDLSPDTLEPRPDTETLIEAVLESFADKPPATILDLGTGSGCILISLLGEFPSATGTGVDLSSGACDAALGNSRRLGFQDRCRILNGSWLEPLANSDRFDLIVSNPPYIPQKDIANLQGEVRNYDPILALDGGNDGLAPYKILLPKLKKHLSPSGRVFLEFGYGQDADISRLAAKSGATLIRIKRDLGGVARVAELVYPASGDK